MAGGEVVGADSIEAAFATGKGHITLRGIATVEQEGSKAGTYTRLAAVRVLDPLPKLVSAEVRLVNIPHSRA